MSWLVERLATDPLTNLPRAGAERPAYQAAGEDQLASDLSVSPVATVCAQDAFAVSCGAALAEYPDEQPARVATSGMIRQRTKVLLSNLVFSQLNQAAT